MDFPLVGPHELWLGETLVAERAERNLRLVVIVDLCLVGLEETKSCQTKYSKLFQLLAFSVKQEKLRIKRTSLGKKALSKTVLVYGT